MKDPRRNPYGVGSLKDSLVKGKRKLEDSSCFVALEEQVKEAQRKIEEQVAYTQRRDAAREEVSRSNRSALPGIHGKSII